MDDFAAARKAKDPTASGGLPEPLARSYLRQLMEGIQYCHSHRVLHRWAPDRRGYAAVPLKPFYYCRDTPSCLFFVTPKTRDGILI
jgi:hypothetical protein